MPMLWMCVLVTGLVRYTHDDFRYSMLRVQHIGYECKHRCAARYKHAANLGNK